MVGKYGGDGYPVDPATQQVDSAQEPRSLVVPKEKPGTAQTVGVGIAQVPTTLIGGDGIRIGYTSLRYSVNLAIDKLEPADGAMLNQWVAVYDSELGSDNHRRIPVTLIPVDAPHDDLVYGRWNGQWVDVTSFVTIGWGDITGKPDTFPPTLPINQSDVIDLIGDLAALYNAITTLNTVKADKTYVDNQNAAQDTIIAAKADKSYVDAQNAAQDTVIASKASTTYVDAQNAAQDTVIAGKIGEAPNDGKFYSRKSLAWAESPPFPEAPNDGAIYGRKGSTTSWEKVVGGATVSDTAPAGPQQGQLWWESDSGALSISYDDGDSVQWVQVNAASTLGEAPLDGALYGRASGAWAKGVKLSGDTMTGALNLPGDPTAAAHAARKAYVDAGDAAATALANGKVSKAGDTMTGPLVLPGDPTAAEQAARKAYVDAGDAAATAVANGKVSKGGDTMTGGLYMYNNTPITFGAEYSFTRDPGSGYLHIWNNNHNWSTFYLDYLGNIYTHALGNLQGYINNEDNYRVHNMRWTGGSDIGWSQGNWSNGDDGVSVMAVHWGVGAVVDAVRIRYLQYYTNNSGWVTTGHQ